MTGYSRGDVVLVPYPIGDRLSSKKRPALVVSATDEADATTEVVIAQITGHLDGPPRLGDHKVAQWQEAGLLRPSLVRCRLATLPISAIIRKLGTLDDKDLRGVEAGLRAALGL